MATRTYKSETGGWGGSLEPQFEEAPGCGGFGAATVRRETVGCERRERRLPIVLSSRQRSSQRVCQRAVSYKQHKTFSNHKHEIADI